METAENSEEKKKKKEDDQSRFRKMRRMWRGRRLGKKTERGCQVCFLPPASSDSPETASRSGKLDEFCPDLVRALIEKNDFYSKECNVHLGV